LRFRLQHQNKFLLQELFSSPIIGRISKLRDKFVVDKTGRNDLIRRSQRPNIARPLCSSSILKRNTIDYEMTSIAPLKWKPAFSVKSRIWLSSIILTICGVLTVWISYHAGKGVSHIAEENEPALNHLGIISSALRQAQSELRFSLLTSDHEYRRDFLASLDRVEQVLADLKRMPIISTDEETHSLSKLSQLVYSRFGGTIETATKIVDSPEYNMPGLKLQRHIIAPVHETIEQHIKELLKIVSQSTCRQLVSSQERERASSALS